MAVLPTLKLRHKRNGRIRIVNQTTYAMNLGSWQDWDVISARSGDASEKEVRFDIAQEEIERTRVNNPKSPAFGDARNAYEQRAVTVNTNASPEPEKVNEYVAVEVLPVVEETTSVVEREVPVIGGKQTVKVNAKKPGRPKTNSQDEVL